MRSLLRPTNDYAADAILPGDPAIALDLAQALIEGPLMANHARGLWGYSGPALGVPSRRLAIQSTGYGVQSTAAVTRQLGELGVERAIRVGTCVAIDGALACGDRLMVTEAVAADGTVLAAGERLTGLLSRALPGSPATGMVASVDVAAGAAAIAPDALAADGSSAGLIGAAGNAGIEAAVALVVVESDGRELEDETVRELLGELGRDAWRALIGERAGSA